MKKSGSAFRIVVNGVLYSSIFKASLETGLSYKWILYKLHEKNGAPVKIKKKNFKNIEFEIHSESYEIGKQILEENMSDTNLTVIEGRLTRNAEMKAAGQSTVVTFSIANNKSIKKDGQWVNIPSFFDCELWGKYAEAMYPHLLKGTMLTVTGKLKQESWKDSNGHTQSRVKIVCENLSPRYNSGSSQASQPDTSFEPVTDEANPYGETVF